MERKNKRKRIIKIKITYLKIKIYIKKFFLQKRKRENKSCIIYCFLLVFFVHIFYKNITYIMFYTLISFFIEHFFLYIFDNLFVKFSAEKK